MRSFAWIIGLLLCTVYGVQAQDRVIERPPFLAWSSIALRLIKLLWEIQLPPYTSKLIIALNIG